MAGATKTIPLRIADLTVRIHNLWWDRSPFDFFESEGRAHSSCYCINRNSPRMNANNKKKKSGKCGDGRDDERMNDTFWCWQGRISQGYRDQEAACPQKLFYQTLSFHLQQYQHLQHERKWNGESEAWGVDTGHEVVVIKQHFGRRVDKGVPLKTRRDSIEILRWALEREKEGENVVDQRIVFPSDWGDEENWDNPMVWHSFDWKLSEELGEGMRKDSLQTYHHQFSLEEGPYELLYSR